GQENAGRGARRRDTEEGRRPTHRPVEPHAYHNEGGPPDGAPERRLGDRQRPAAGGGAARPPGAAAPRRPDPVREPLRPRAGQGVTKARVADTSPKRKRGMSAIIPRLRFGLVSRRGLGFHAPGAGSMRQLSGPSFALSRSRIS